MTHYIELQLCDANGDVVKYQRIADVSAGVDPEKAFDGLRQVIDDWIVESTLKVVEKGDTR